MAFSGALTLTDLNDFITPSQACIKPVEQQDAPLQERDAGAAATEIMIDSSGAYYEVANNSTAKISTSNRKLAQAQISLNDCLACSGCITSAESVLITLQSHTEVLNFLASNSELPQEQRSITVVSIAPQSLASLAASLPSTSTTGPDPITLHEVLQRVKSFCQDVLGFDHVFDTTYARELALREHLKEFFERREADGRGDEGQLPMLASACPGWICYAEKAHAEMLPFISKTKSPQQVMGTLVKNWLGPKWGRKPDGVYHVSVMPCYDKKLEASRKDFYDEIYSTRDVDCVITTGELEMLMQEKGWDLSAPVGERHLHQKGRVEKYIPELVVQRGGSSSGSYLQSIIRHLEETASTKLEVSVKMIRNADYEEYTITEGDRVIFKGAKCYGFRNLQNVVRKVGKERGVRTGIGAAGRLGGVKTTGGLIKKENKKYDYVEVMACPGGCVNGGGQLRTMQVDNKDWGDGMPSGKWGDREWTRKVEEAYWRNGNGDENCSIIEMDSKMLRTEYRAVESDVIGLAVKW